MYKINTGIIIDKAGKTAATPADLTYNILVGESDNQSILGRIVLVTVLDYEALSCIVVRLTLCQRHNIAQLIDSLVQYVFIVFSANLLTGTNNNEMIQLRSS